MKTRSIHLIQAAISEAATPNGYAKFGSSWYANRPESILVVSPQKSQYGDKYYVNLGVFFRILGPASLPKEKDCHIRARLAGVAGAESRRLSEQALDFEEPFQSLDERKRTLSGLVRSEGLPFLERCSSISGVKPEFDQGHLDSFAIVQALRQILLRSK